MLWRANIALDCLWTNVMSGCPSPGNVEHRYAKYACSTICFVMEFAKIAERYFRVLLIQPYWLLCCGKKQKSVAFRANSHFKRVMPQVHHTTLDCMQIWQGVTNPAAQGILLQCKYVQPGAQLSEDPVIASYNWNVMSPALSLVLYLV